MWLNLQKSSEYEGGPASLVPIKKYLRHDSQIDVYLPDSDDGVCDEDEQNDKWFDEGGDRVLVFLKEGQDKGDDGGQQKDLDQQVIKLLEDQLPQGLALLGWQLCKYKGITNSYSIQYV